MKNLSDLRNIEQAVLSYLRLTNDNFQTIKEQLTEDCFIFLAHREIFGLISEQDTNKLFHSDKQLNIFANTMDKYSVVKKAAVINALSQAPSIDIKQDIKTLYQEFLKRKVALRSGAMKKRGSIETKHGLVWFEFADDRLILVESTDISNLPIELHDNFNDTLHAISSLDLKSDDNELKVIFYGDNKNPEGIESFHLKKNKIELQWLEVLYKWADKNDLDQTVFPRNRYKLQSMTELDLSEQGLTKLPKEIGKLDKLDTLIFNNNKIQELPNNFSKLKSIIISNNHRIITLPKSIVQLKQLEQLEIENTQISEIPIKLLTTTTLNKLSVNDNLLQFLIENINYLDVDKCQIIINLSASNFKSSLPILKDQILKLIQKCIWTRKTKKRMVVCFYLKMKKRIKIMKIPTDELFESLKLGYVDYKESLTSGASEVDLAYIMGFCRSIEQMLNVYGNVSDETISKIKRPIIGDRSFHLGEKKSLKDIDYEVPTFLRQK